MRCRGVTNCEPCSQPSCKLLPTWGEERARRGGLLKFELSTLLFEAHEKLIPPYLKTGAAINRESVLFASVLLHAALRQLARLLIDTCTVGSACYIWSKPHRALYRQSPLEQGWNGASVFYLFSLLWKHNLTSKNNNTDWIWLLFKVKVRGLLLIPQSLWQIKQQCLKRSKVYCLHACCYTPGIITKNLAGSLHYCCRQAEHTSNSTPPAKPTCLAQSSKEKVIFPLWNRIQGRGCRGLVTAEQHTGNSRHNSRPHLPPLIRQAACLRG